MWSSCLWALLVSMFVMKVLTFRNITMAKLTLITVLHLIFIEGFIPDVDNQMCSSTTEGAA